MSNTTDHNVPFVSMPVDTLLIGGLSIVHFILFALFSRGLTRADFALESYFNTQISAAAIAAYVTWAVNHPHFSATSARLYRSRASIMQFPVTAIGVPLVLMVMVWLSMALPSTFAPWFIKVYMVWSSYHFSAQSVGVSLLYARRAGLVVEGPARRLLSWFIFSTFLGPTLRSETYPQGSSYYDVAMPVLGLPSWVWPFFISVMVVTALAGLILLLRTAWVQEKRVPLLMLIPPAAQLCWFVLGSGINGYSEFVPAYHSLQYLFIAWIMNLRERQVERQIAPSVRYVTRESLYWFTMNVVGGIFLFWWLPKNIQNFGLAATQFQTWGIVIAAVQVHHFFVDGVIWKLKNPAVGQPLATTMTELSGSRT